MTARFTSVLAATALALAFGTAAMAQTPAAPATTAAKPAAAAKKAPVPKVATTEIGKKCSADADAAGKHGKDRKAFRAKCARDM